MRPSAAGGVPAFTLPDRLRRARKEAGLTQAQLAAELSISRATVNIYERGHRTPSLPVILAWALVCGVDSDWLAGHPASRKEVRGRVAGLRGLQGIAAVLVAALPLAGAVVNVT